MRNPATVFCLSKNMLSFVRRQYWWLSLIIIYSSITITYHYCARKTLNVHFLLFRMICHSASQHFQHFPKGMVFCSSSISCAKRWPLALERLRFMSKLGRTPNTVCCNAAIGVCEKMSKWQQAIAMMRQMPLGYLGSPWPIGQLMPIL